MSGFSRRWFGGGPGNAARERREQEQQFRQQQEAATQDPYGATPPQWDEQGFPVGPMPKGKYALDYQYEANRRAEQRRMALWGDAQNSMRQGLDLFQSYRPGGSAAAASGMYGQKAGLYATQALNTSAPDLLIDWREQIRARAEENANELNRNAQLITGLSSFNVLAGGTLAALQPGPAQPTEQNTKGAGGTYNVGAGGQPPVGAPDAGYGNPSTPMPATNAAGQPAGAPSVLPGVLPPERRIGGGSALDVLDAGGGGGGAPGPGGPGGGGRGQGGGGGRGMDAAGSGATAMGGGGGGLGDYSGQAVADRSIGGAPTAVDMTTSILADDPYRQQSIAIMAQSARQTLLDALALG